MSKSIAVPAVNKNNFSVVLLDKRSGRYSKPPEKAAARQQRIDPCFRSPWSCIHFDEKQNEDGTTTREHCSNKTVPGRQNGFLCHHHHTEVIPAAVKQQEARPAGVKSGVLDAALIVEMDKWDIAVAMSQGDRKELRLTDLRYCRRIWNRRPDGWDAPIKSAVSYFKKENISLTAAIKILMEDLGWDVLDARILKFRELWTAK